MGLPATGGEALLLTRSCTTGWADWVHGELWLLPHGLLRVRGSWADTIAAATRMDAARTWLARTGETFAPGQRLTLEAAQDLADYAASQHRRNCWITWAAIASARLRLGVTTDRLAIRRNNGSRVRFLWLKGDPASSLLRPVLETELGSTFTVD